MEVCGFQTECHEAHWIARTVGKALAAGISPGEILDIAARTDHIGGTGRPAQPGWDNGVPGAGR